MPDSKWRAASAPRVVDRTRQVCPVSSKFPVRIQKPDRSTYRAEVDIVEGGYCYPRRHAVVCVVGFRLRVDPSFEPLESVQVSVPPKPRGRLLMLPAQSGRGLARGAEPNLTNQRTERHSDTAP